MNYKTIALILMVALVACQPKKEKLSKRIYELEIADTSSTPEGMNALADLYYEYATEYPKDSISEKFLYKGFMFKYIHGKWDDAIKFASFYKSNYPKADYYNDINLKLADVYYTGKHNLDSAVRYYMQSDGKARFSADEYRKAGFILAKSSGIGKDPNQKANILFTSARCYQAGAVFDTAVMVYTRVANEYPSFVNSPDALMAAGFICWNDLKKPDEAKAYYKQLYEKYPNSPLAREARMIVEEDITGMTDLELSEYLMKKRKEKGEVQ